jgi:hypothetical protein
MKKLLLLLSIIFTFLTLAGAIFVLTSGGTASAGYAVVPFAIALPSFAGYVSYKKR